MSPVAAASVWPTDRRRAYGAGVVAGLLTLTVGWLMVAQLGRIDVVDARSGFDLEAGDCLESTENEPSVLQVVDCSLAHDGEVVGIATHRNSGRTFPGEDVTSVWFEEGCRSVTTDYLGAGHLTTTLNAGIMLPSERQWNDGVHHAVCYVTIGDGDDPLTESVKGRAIDFARGEIVRIDRLMAGDCFNPAGAIDPFGLRSSDLVELTDCSGSFSGLFFGRGDLPYGDGVPIPSAGDLTDSSTTACSAEFESFFGVESAVGYTFRFWRPSKSKWDDGYRAVLCAVLSDEPIDGPYVPADYPELHKLGTGQCFQFLPEQTARSLTLDDHVRPVRCSQPHVGQMIGSGQFDADRRFPGNELARAMAERECGSLFEAFVGIDPAGSRFGRFPFWYPNEEAWAMGDTRYACAVLAEELTESLQGSSR